jgi:hypothetical protein
MAADFQRSTGNQQCTDLRYRQFPLQTVKSGLASIFDLRVVRPPWVDHFFLSVFSSSWATKDDPCSKDIGSAGGLNRPDACRASTPADSAVFAVLLKRTNSALEQIPACSTGFPKCCSISSMTRNSRPHVRMGSAHTLSASRRFGLALAAARRSWACVVFGFGAVPLASTKPPLTFDHPLAIPLTKI